MSLTPKRTHDFLKDFLSTLRSAVSDYHLEFNRLPGWVKGARVRFGWINDSLVSVFEESDTDRYLNRNRIGADTVILFDTGDFIPSGASLHALQNDKGIIIMKGEYGNNKRVIFNLKGERPALYDCGYYAYHGPLALFDIFCQHTPNDVTIPIMTRFVPFALYAHKKDANTVDWFWKLCKTQLMSHLHHVHNSEEGTFYENLNARYSSFAMSKESGIVILGKDTGPELGELLMVKDYVSSKGYNADLIKGLPDTYDVAR